MEDFVPWVAPISSHSPASEEKEEKDEMADLVHNFDTQKRKWGAIFKRAIDATLEVVGEADQYPTSEGLKGQAIIIMDSPEMDFHSQSASETAFLTDLGGVPLTHEEVWEGIPSEKIASWLERATASRSGRSRLLLPNRLLLNSYIPPQG